MPAKKRTQPVSPKTQTDIPAFHEIRTIQDARNAFASFLDDERELKSAAATFFKLGSQLVGRRANHDERNKLLGEIYEQIIRDPTTGKERSPEEKAWDPLESTCRHASLSIL